MKPFELIRPQTVAEAAGLETEDNTTIYVAGGTTAVDLMKYHIWQPERVVDVRDVAPTGITIQNKLLRIGAGETMTDVAYHPEVKQNFPMIVDSLLLAASQGIRNSATIGGNILQRSRCPYFRNPSYRCNRREPGSGCDAIGGWNRYHAVLGTSEQCIAAHASDLCVALAALASSVVVQGTQGERRVSFTDFHKLPGDTPAELFALQPGELITYVEVPVGPAARNSVYVKVRDRNSYAFALCSAAAGLDLQDGQIKQARLGLGGVGTVPWKATEAEQFLLGKAPTEANFTEAARRVTEGAQISPSNAFKVPLVQRTLVEALTQVAQG